MPPSNPRDDAWEATFQVRDSPMALEQPLVRGRECRDAMWQEGDERKVLNHLLGLSLCRAKPFEGLTILGGGGWGCRTASAADMSDQRWAQRASADRGPEESVVGTWRPARHSGSPVLSRPVSLSVSPLCPGPVSFSRQLAMRCSMRSLGSAPQGAYNTGNIFVDRVHLKKLKAAKKEAL